ncbi:hypothetical protein [Micromonospora sp. NPDC005211]|uniref:hypothetical protein n=1 Tax=Micromonospora sp. NPDC005211 TaxID=3157023 RepID=UPI0033BEFC8A
MVATEAEEGLRDLPCGEGLGPKAVDYGVHGRQAVRQVFNDGSVVLGTDGCGMYWLLIVTGLHRGHVWNISSEGAMPFGAEVGFTTGDAEFIGWVEHWAASKPWFDAA